MALDVQVLEREFTYNKIQLPDIKGATLKEISKHYSGVYPELLNATPEFVEIKGGKEIYQFNKKSAGVKG